MINNHIEVVDDLNSHALPLPLLLTISPFSPYYFPPYFLLLPSLLPTTSLLTPYYFSPYFLLLPPFLLTTPPFPPYYFSPYSLLLPSLLLHLLAFALRFLSFCIAFS